MFLITDSPIDASAVVSETSSPEDGAVATFMGIVRNNSGDKTVRGLYYEAYAPMALKSFEDIALEAKVLWDISDVSIAHRVGTLVIGETAVMVAVAAPHRREALAACAYVIDRVKEISPVWKKDLVNDLVHAF